MRKFIGGYYVEGLDMEQKGLAFTETLVMTLEEAKEHPGITYVDDYAESNGVDYYTSTEEEKISYIEEYILNDEIFGGRFYEEKEAKEFLVELEENKLNYDK